MASVIFMTDPMCSWCWGMAAQIERLRSECTDAFEFDLQLGGINVDSSRPLSDAGRVRLQQLWRSVAQVTSVSFGAGPPVDDFIYNSTQACVAVEAMREVTGRAPFEYLMQLQRSFFIDGRDITRRDVLREQTVLAAPARARWEALLDAPHIMARVREGFTRAKSYGTAALPSVVIETAGTRRLLAGGYVDAPTMSEALRMATPRG
jgi:putative protein-disulfide isomerase